MALDLLFQDLVEERRIIGSRASVIIDALAVNITYWNAITA